MATFFYSPGIRILISTVREGIIEVTDDIVRSQVVLNENSPHKVSFSLLNARRKYDGVFTPNDRIVVRLKRIAWLQVFAGYLDRVPMFSVYPRTIEMAATCSLKRLLYNLWDPGAQASVDLLNSIRREGEDQDGNIAEKATEFLVRVGNWPRNQIHIGAIPSDWADKVNQIQASMQERLSIPDALLGPGGTIAGDPVAGMGESFVLDQNGNPDAGPGYGVIPNTTGKVSYFGGVGTTDATGKMNLTGEPGTNPTDVWYLAMRWAYNIWDPSLGARGRVVPNPALTPAQRNFAMSWWKNRRMLVTHPGTGRSVVVRAADWGPAGWTNKDVDLSRHALETVLGGKTTDTVHVAFAPAGAPLGPYTGPTHGTPGASVPSPTPTTAQGNIVVAEGDSSGVRFTSADLLAPNTHAARDFIRQNWSGFSSIGGFANRTTASGKPSDHATGHALDVMVSSGSAQGPQKALGTSIAMWFVQNPHVFGTKYVIWYDYINSGNGWTRYTGNMGSWPLASPTLGHRDHPHISFHRTSARNPGPAGNGFTGSDYATMAGLFGEGVSMMPGGTVPFFGGPVSTAGGLPGVPLINAQNWHHFTSPESLILAEDRALMNDEALLPFVTTLMNASLRSYCSAPNGDFIAWFPDYFGSFDIAGVMEIEPIEIDDFTMDWDDQHLVTHQYVTGSFSGYGAPGVQAEMAMRNFETQGVATVQIPEVLNTLLNIDPDDPRSGGWGDGDEILKRFGARVDHRSMGMLASRESEFWYALYLFQRNWARQFHTNVPLSFMPELYPGMLIQLKRFGIQFYIESVTHNVTFQEGVGFSTSVRAVAPSSIGGGFYGLPRGG